MGRLMNRALNAAAATLMARNNPNLGSCPFGTVGWNLWKIMVAMYSAKGWSICHASPEPYGSGSVAHPAVAVLRTSL